MPVVSVHLAQKSRSGANGHMTVAEPLRCGWSKLGYAVRHTQPPILGVNKGSKISH